LQPGAHPDHAAVQDVRRIVVNLRGSDIGIVRALVIQARAYTVNEMDDEIGCWFHAGIPVVVGSGAILGDSAVHHFVINQLLLPAYLDWLRLCKYPFLATGKQL
jgi:hypothetical protein